MNHRRVVRPQDRSARYFVGRPRWSISAQPRHRTINLPRQAGGWRSWSQVARPDGVNGKGLCGNYVIKFGFVAWVHKKGQVAKVERLNRTFFELEKCCLRKMWRLLAMTHKVPISMNYNAWTRHRPRYVINGSKPSGNGLCCIGSANRKVHKLRVLPIGWC